ncbi:MAG: cysteine synthase A [Gammaproteobacteria bacterium]|jgi:cysteine synthase A|nr:cysteine synthase A [Gammaproteobacteria bacterium]
MIHDSIIDTIGRTPIVRINRLTPPDMHFYVKIEAFNPMSSVKDRLAWAIINDAERSGALKPGQTVIEATSGNTGIALAMVCAARGYPFVAVMTETFSIERRKLIRALGARVVLTPKEWKGSGMVQAAQKMAEKHGWFLARQFVNPANPAYHRQTTGPEILSDFAGRLLDYFVTGYGTGGTLSGAGIMLKAARPAINIVVTEPEQAGLLAGKPWSPHKIQGLTPDFIPEVLDRDVFDINIPVNEDDAMHWSRELARKEGIFCGISAGATFAAAIQLAESIPSGSHVLIMLPDTGERYLSTPLWADLKEGSDEDLLDGIEVEI